MTDNQFKVLQVFFSNDTDYCYPYRTFVNDSGLDLATVKQTMKELKALGYAKVYHGLMSEEGEVAGSGFGLVKYDEVSKLFYDKEQHVVLSQLKAKKTLLEQQIADLEADIAVKTAASPDFYTDTTGSQNATNRPSEDSIGQEGKQ